MDLSDYAPAFLLQTWHGMTLWAWIGLPLRFVAAYAISIMVGRTFMASTRYVFKRRPAYAENINAIVPPLELMVAVALFKAGRQVLPLGEQAAHYVHLVELFVGSFASGWLFFRLADLMGRRMESSLARKGRRQAVAIIPLLRRLMKGAIGVLTILFLLQNLGFNVSAMLAGLGIGGVAIALASQKTVENLFGGVMLVLDQPIRVGDFGKFGDYMGTVEDIGLRSTRIRTLDRTIVTVPNGDFSQLKLESFTARDMLRFSETFGLAYHTPVENLKKILAEITALLGKDNRIAQGFHVRLVDFTINGLQIEIFSYVKTADNDVFLAVREELFLAIMAIVRANGSDFALPAQTLYTGSEAQKSDDSAAKTTTAVKNVVAAGALAEAERIL